MAHLAARYRQAAFGEAPDPSHLLRPTDRRLLSSEHMAGQLLGGCGSFRAGAACTLRVPLPLPQCLHRLPQPAA